MFEIETTEEFDRWFATLTDEQVAAIRERLALLRDQGPLLRRPVVGEIKDSAYDPQMKELRVDQGGAVMRILFIFDPRRVAVLLIGGDKARQGNRWYRRAIRDADRLYAEHLKRIGRS